VDYRVVAVVQVRGGSLMRKLSAESTGNQLASGLCSPEIVTR